MPNLLTTRPLRTFEDPETLHVNVLDLKIPYTDLKVNVSRVLKAQCNLCPDNTLFPMNHTVEDFYVCAGLSHREEIVINGWSTYFTHSYLLKCEDMPWCIPCTFPNTVKHILLHCIKHLNETYKNVQ